MRLQSYNNIQISVIDQTPFPKNIIQLACDATQKKDIDWAQAQEATPRLLQFLMTAGHTSVFEHNSLVFLARGISRSLLAQITRERMFSFTSASQHYQDYRKYPMSLRPGFHKNAETGETYEAALNFSLKQYIKLIELGEKPEEARQVLPNACTVVIVVTANIRSLIHFLQTRLCKRNTLEMRIFTGRLKAVCCTWVPQIFNKVGPACFVNKCDQGRLSCNKPYSE